MASVGQYGMYSIASRARRPALLLVSTLPSTPRPGEGHLLSVHYAGSRQSPGGRSPSGVSGEMKDCYHVFSRCMFPLPSCLNVLYLTRTDLTASFRPASPRPSHAFPLLLVPFWWVSGSLFPGLPELGRTSLVPRLAPGNHCLQCCTL